MPSGNPAFRFRGGQTDDGDHSDLGSHSDLGEGGIQIHSSQYQLTLTHHIHTASSAVEVKCLSASGIEIIFSEASKASEVIKVTKLNCG